MQYFHWVKLFCQACWHCAGNVWLLYYMLIKLSSAQMSSQINQLLVKLTVPWPTTSFSSGHGHPTGMGLKKHLHNKPLDVIHELTQRNDCFVRILSLTNVTLYSMLKKIALTKVTVWWCIWRTCPVVKHTSEQRLGRKKFISHVCNFLVSVRMIAAFSGFFQFYSKHRNNWVTCQAWNLSTEPVWMPMVIFIQQGNPTVWHWAWQSKGSDAGWSGCHVLLRTQSRDLTGHRILRDSWGDN